MQGHRFNICSFCNASFSFLPVLVASFKGIGLASVFCRKNAQAEAAQYTAAEKEAEKLSKKAEQAANVTKDLVRYWQD